MTLPSTNDKISILINSQSPFFVRNDHETFVRFMEAYYEWMEKADANTSPQYNVVTRAKNILSFQDIDRTVDEFADELYKTYLKLIPEETRADKRILMKNIKDFYRARGTEKSGKFLLRVLFDVDSEFYYPKVDVLKFSDGKWFIEKSLKFSEVYDNNVLTNDIIKIQNFVGKTVTGNTSGAKAAVERVDSYYEGATLIRELKISNQTKNFISGETIFTTYENEEGVNSLRANIFSGIINSVEIVKPGTLYKTGDMISVISNTGTGAVIQVGRVTTGNIRSLFTVYGGAGYQVASNVFISDITGTGATANISNVNTSGLVHPNTYNICISIISTEANTNISNSIYSTLNNANANVTLANAFVNFLYENTGPIISTLILNAGNNYTSNATITPSANSRIRALGILGRMEIQNGGTGYANGDVIEFINVSGGYGVGAQANVRNVDANGTIQSVQFVQIPGFVTGGIGYDQSCLPLANVISANGNGANIQVTSVLGYGANIRAISDSLGQIQSIVIVSGGGQYEDVTLDLTGIGDGTAQATAQIVTGAFTYPGRFLNDDGNFSGYNFIQDRDYYQTFSYVVKTRESINKYRKYFKDLIHPAGLKMFGEYLVVDDTTPLGVTGYFKGTEGNNLILVTGTYVSTANAVTNKIEITVGRNTSNVTNVYIEFLSGDTANISNGRFAATPNNSNSFIIYQPRSNAVLATNSSGNVLTSI